MFTKFFVLTFSLVSEVHTEGGISQYLNKFKCKYLPKYVYIEFKSIRPDIYGLFEKNIIKASIQKT